MRRDKLCPALATGKVQNGCTFFHSMGYSVYILYSESADRYYTGHTGDVEKRLLQHNSGRTPSTKTGRPWGIRYVEGYPDKASAARREIEIKNKKSRRYIEWLIGTCCAKDTSIPGEKNNSEQKG